MITVIEDEYERYKDIYPELQAEYEQRKEEFEAQKNRIFALIDHEPEIVTKVSNFFADKDAVTALKEANNLTLDYLQASNIITGEELEAFYRHAKFKYECGLYDDSQTMLGQYLSVQQTVNPALQGALWGKLACGILQGLWMNNMQKDSQATAEDRAHAQAGAPRQWQSALQDFQALKESMEFRPPNAMDQLRQRAWLLHWGMFVFFNQKEGVEGLIDLFSERAYLQTMENLCPWMLRYYCIGLILTPSRRKHGLKDVLQEISLLSYQYSDPITQFLEALFDTFDFELAEAKLIECQKLIQTDFFLQVHGDKFLHEARMLICEMYCTVYGSIDLVSLARMLQMSEEDAEKWMVDMVHGSAWLDAKIDSHGKQVIIAPASKSAHKQVVEATKEVTSRSATLAANLENVARDQSAFLRARYSNYE